MSVGHSIMCLLLLYSYLRVLVLSYKGYLHGGRKIHCGTRQILEGRHFGLCGAQVEKELMMASDKTNFNLFGPFCSFCGVNNYLSAELSQ